MSQEIELAAQTIGSVVGAAIDASGISAPMKEVTAWLASWLHPRLVASGAEQMMAAVERLERAGIRPGAVRDEQMRSLLEEGAREEDPDLRDKWTNLLANGLAGKHEGIPRAYAETLRQLEPSEALALDRMASGTLAVTGTGSGTRMGQGDGAGLSLQNLPNLERLGLIELKHNRPLTTRFPGKISPEVDRLKLVGLTQFGVGFIAACQPPEALRR